MRSALSTNYPTISTRYSHKERRGWNSNPRDGFPPTPLATSLKAAIHGAFARLKNDQNTPSTGRWSGSAFWCAKVVVGGPLNCPEGKIGVDFGRLGVVHSGRFPSRPFGQKCPLYGQHGRLGRLASSQRVQDYPHTQTSIVCVDAAHFARRNCQTSIFVSRDDHNTRRQNQGPGTFG